MPAPKGKSLISARFQSLHASKFHLPGSDTKTMGLDTLRQGFSMRQLQDRKPGMQLNWRRAEAQGGPPAGADLDPIVRLLTPNPFD